MARPFDNRDITMLIATAVDHLGTAEFYDKLLDVAGSAAPHDLAALVRYSRTAPPDLILPRVESNEALQSYYSHFYTFDPFYSHWKKGGEIGVFRMRALDPSIDGSRYAREFLQIMAIHDEIAIFLPPFGDGSPTLILDRASRPFTAVEVGRVRRLFPLLAALHRRHISSFVTAGVAPGASPLGQQRPLRLVDRHGHQLFTTKAWLDTTRHAGPAVIELLAIMNARGPCSMRLPGHGILRRTQLPSDFGPAPNGFCDEISTEPGQGGPEPSHPLPASLANQLTERECQVVVLTLQGYPVLEIARRLRLSRGTVKNYRLAIYRKLDITTERELFGEYMAAVRNLAQAPAQC